MNETLQVIQAKDEASSEAVSVIESAINEAHQAIKTGFASWSETFRVSTFSMCTQIEKASLNGSQMVCLFLTVSFRSHFYLCLKVDKALKSMGSLIETIVREAQEHVEIERKSVLDTKVLADSAANDEIARLQEQNAHLADLLENERVKSERARDDLIQRISGLLGDFVVDRDRSLREAFTDITESNVKAEGAMASFIGEHVNRVEGVVVRGLEWSAGLEKKGGEGKRLRDGALKVRHNIFWLAMSSCSVRSPLVVSIALSKKGSPRFRIRARRLFHHTQQTYSSRPTPCTLRPQTVIPLHLCDCVVV